MSSDPAQIGGQLRVKEEHLAHMTDTVAALQREHTRLHAVEAAMKELTVQHHALQQAHDRCTHTH